MQSIAQVFIDEVDEKGLIWYEVVVNGESILFDRTDREGFVAEMGNLYDYIEKNYGKSRRNR